MASPILTIPDLVALDDLDAFGRETTSDLQTLWQDVYHVLIEVLGSNIDDVERGVGIRQLLSGATTSLAKLAAHIDQALERDPRIDGSTTTITPDPAGGFRIEIVIAVGASTVGLQYSYSAASGLVFEGQ